MSKIKSDDSDITIDASGSGRDIKFQANGVEKASISSAGAFTSTTIDATKLTGTIPNFTSTGIDDNADATAMTITSAERVGINKTSPDARLDISAASETGLRVVATVSGEYPVIFQSASTNSTPIADFRSNGGTTRLQVTSDGRGLSQFTAKAWANLNGTGTIALRDSHNISSVTDNGTGDYSFNFTNNLANANYSVTNSFSRDGWDNFVSIYPGHQSVSATRVTMNDTSATAGVDTDGLFIQVFGD